MTLVSSALIYIVYLTVSFSRRRYTYKGWLTPILSTDSSLT